MNHQYLLEVNHLNKDFTNDSDYRIFHLNDIDFHIEPGYIVGLVGCNGAGKTTLLKTIMGAYMAQPGQVIMNGYDRVTQMQKAKQQIAFVTDECMFPLGLSPRRIGNLYGHYYDGFDMQHFHQLCDRFHISWHKMLGRNSKGNIIKAQLAFAFSHPASLYIFDEPSAGLDPVFRKELLEYYYEIVSDGTKSVLLSTHLTDELDQVADYILYLDNGEQRLYMTKEELFEKYMIIRGSFNQVNYYRNHFIGIRDGETCCEALVRNDITEFPASVVRQRPTIEDIMYYFKKGGKKDA